MYFPTLKQNRASRRQFEKCAANFDAMTSQSIRRVMKNDNTHVIELLLLYDNMNYLVFKVLGVVIYYTINKNVCIGYVCLYK